VALNGFTTKEHIDIACAVADNSRGFSQAEIDEVEKHIIDNMNTLCTSCGYCLADCPQDIPIASYLQYYNEKLLFGISDQDMIKGLDHHHTWGILADRKAEAADCIQCGKCEQACTQHLNIMDRLREIAGWEAKQKEKQQREKAKGS
jgi:uncharacterized protein